MISSLTLNHMAPLRLLVLDAYPRDGRRALVEAGGTEAGVLYQRMLHALEPDSTVGILYPADPEPELPTAAVNDYDAWAWTGSSLTLRHAADPRVVRQVDLAKLGYERGVPQFGSCWAVQLAVVAAGGEVRRNPKGREFGFARDIELSEAGSEHPMYRGRTSGFDAYACHADIVTRLPPGASLLASNELTPVQAVAVEHRRGSFWALQYHPEYDLHEIASLGRLRRDELVTQGIFDSHGCAARWIETSELLHRDPDRTDFRSDIGADNDILDDETRTREVRNWLGYVKRLLAGG